MKVAPVSADLLVKLALGAAVIGAAWWAFRRVQATAGSVGDQLAGAASAAVEAVTPWNPNNIINRGANAVFQGATGSQNSIGTAIWEVFNDDPGWTDPTPYVRPEEPASPAWSTGGGRWNNPSAYQSPGVTGDGGAAFGIYPRA